MSPTGADSRGAAGVVRAPAARRSNAGNRAIPSPRRAPAVARVSETAIVAAGIAQNRRAYFQELRL